jgi:formylglycine-generating enzyme required for sulfatase activity
MANPAEGAAWFYFDRPTDQALPGQASFKHDKAPDRPCKVGTHVPNKLGLHDMHGNVNEWCADACRNPFGGVGRVTRGGAYWVTADQLKSGNLARRTGRSATRPALARVRVMQVNPRATTSTPGAEVAALPAEKQPAAVADLLRRARSATTR